MFLSQSHSGECTKKYDGDSITYRVVEQTEFIDDSSFSPLRGSNTHAYYKRAAVTNLKSAEKVMYICKDQVGEYEGRPAIARGYLLGLEVMIRY